MVRDTLLVIDVECEAVTVSVLVEETDIVADNDSEDVNDALSVLLLVLLDDGVLLVVVDSKLERLLDEVGRRVFVGGMVAVSSGVHVAVGESLRDGDDEGDPFLDDVAVDEKV